MTGIRTEITAVEVMLIDMGATKMVVHLQYAQPANFRILRMTVSVLTHAQKATLRTVPLASLALLGDKHE